ncbi:MAG: tetratricopeptide repeat protein [Verrucomicrobiota bacterium]
MKRILCLLLLTTAIIHAEGPDQEYVRIYNLINQGDSLKESGNVRAARENYEEAQTGLKKLRTNSPKWNETLTQYRLDYVTEKLAAMGSVSAPVKAPAPAVEFNSTFSTPTNNEPLTPLPTNFIVPTVTLKKERHRSQTTPASTNRTEKPPAQIAPVPDKDVAKLKNELEALEKERDLLKVSMERQKAATNNSNALPKNSTEPEQKSVPDGTKDVSPSPDTAPRSTPPSTSENSIPTKKKREIPAGTGALVAQAERAFAARRFDEAEKKYLEVLRQDEKNVYIIGNLAATEMEMGHTADVEKNVNRALAIDPEDPFCLTLLGMVRFNEGKLDEALSILTRSSKIDPENPETQNYLGITLDQKGELKGAETALRKAITIQPGYGGAHQNLAVVYATQQPPFLELARWHYDRSVSLGNPKNPDVEKLLGAR